MWELIKVEKGEQSSSVKIRKDIVALVQTGWFSDVEIRQDPVKNGIQLVYVVKEKKQIKSIIFTGNTEVKKKKLLDEITLKKKQSFDAFNLDLSIEKLKSFYQKQGYHDATIDVVKSDEKHNRVTLHFIIDEGSYMTISDIKFNGIKVYKAKKLKKIMNISNVKFTTDTLNSGVERLKEFYLNRGYIDFRMINSKLDPIDTNSSSLSIEISEGMQYFIDSVSIVGNSVLTPQNIKHATKLLKVKRIVREKYINKTLRKLNQLYLDIGYLSMKINVQKKKVSPANIQLIFNINEGSPFYIQQIFINNTGKTKDNIFLREILLKPGDQFSLSRFQRSQEKIKNLGFIDEVIPDMYSTDEHNQVGLSFDITEGRPGTLSAGFGYSSVYKLVGELQVSHSNFLGLAQYISVSFSKNTSQTNYDVEWIEKWFLNRPLALSVRVYEDQRESPYVDSYIQDITGVRIGLGPRFLINYSLFFFYNLRRSIIETEMESNKIFASFFNIQLTRDTRDYIFDPSKGSRNTITLSPFGGILGGDLSILKTEFQSSWFYSLFSIFDYKFILSYNFQIANISNYSDTKQDDIPLSEKFFLGGAESIRGYDFRKDVGSDKGGLFYSLVNIEIKIPLYVQRSKTILQMVFFYDIGGSWDDRHDVKLKLGHSSSDEENQKFLKSSIGFGLRITTPIFPIRLDWGFPFNQIPEREQRVFHFTFGTIF